MTQELARVCRVMLKLLDIFTVAASEELAVLDFF